ncbi:MAG: dihydroorotase [Firmicutes bacterium]|nr:dihydroorotase [Bacillota bacterium]
MSGWSLTLLKNGLISSGGQCKRRDVLLEGPWIARVAQAIDCPAASVRDLTGYILSPGFIDLHAHLREPGFSYKETIRTGTRAAAAGGFTTVCAMPNLSPAPDSLDHFSKEAAILRTDAIIEVLPFGAITRGRKGQALADIEALAPHVIGYSDDGKGVRQDAVMEQAMARAAKAGRLLAAHCEDENLVAPGGCVHDGAAARRFGVPGITGESEWRQIERDLALVRKTNVSYHVCHVSARESVALLRRAKAEGLPVTCECTPHQIVFCDEDITADDGRFKMNPPLRAAEDREAIIEGLLDGTIDCIATDHAPHTAAEKANGLAGSAFGVVGFETAFAACYTALVKKGLCGLPFLLEKLTGAPGRILGREVSIAEGMPADLAALDRKATWRVDPERFLSRGRSTPFADRELTGKVVTTWYHGRIVYGEGME